MISEEKKNCANISISTKNAILKKSGQNIKKS